MLTITKLCEAGNNFILATASKNSQRFALKLGEGSDMSSN